MKRYLLYDSGCSSCGHLAETVREAVGDSIDLLGLRTAEAKELLDTALPQGWRFAPYVVTVDEQGVHARTGFLASMQLGLWMGPRRAMRVWKVVTQEFAPKRRGFLRGSFASILVVLFMRSSVIKAVSQSGCYCGVARCISYIHGPQCRCGFCGCWSRDRVILFKPHGYIQHSCCTRANCGVLIQKWYCGCPQTNGSQPQASPIS